MSRSHPYSGLHASLATRHGKQSLINPVMEAVLGLHVIAIDVDTDSLGTFSGDVPRRGTPRDTVIKKARMGLSASGCSVGLANEGTIGSHPMMPFLIADEEIVCFIDDEFGITVIEGETEFGIPTLGVEIEADRWEEAPLAAGGFPTHGVIVRPVSGLSPIFKGIHDLDELRAAVFECASRGGSKVVRIESDFRAQHHPSRQQVIARAAERLARRLACLCPRCGIPGWGVGRRQVGAQCSLCGGRTRDIMFEHF
ncbi:MAG: DUF6671 family protein [Actinomycetota bacterium]